MDRILVAILPRVRSRKAQQQFANYSDDEDCINWCGMVDDWLERSACNAESTGSSLV